MPARDQKTRAKEKPETRIKRLNIRTTPRQEKLIRLGAQRKGVNVSSFIVDSACAEAEHSLADQNFFALDSSRWSQFLAALDRPARRHKELARLMSEPSILER